MTDIAQLTLPHESIGMSPFELCNGYTPKFSWNWENPIPATSAKEKLNRIEAKQIATRMHEGIEQAKIVLQAKQDEMAKYANRKRRKVDWDVGDYVWVDTRHWKTDRPSHKLSDKWDGPRKVLEKVGTSWRIELPEHIKLHPVFHSSRLRKHIDNPLPGQVMEEPVKYNVLPEQDEWEVKELLGSKTAKGDLFYRASWIGADEDPEYWPASDFMYAPHKIKEFHLKNPTAKGPPRNLLKWIQAYEAGKEDYTELEDDRPMAPSSRTSFFQRGG
jgi:hypothetical protein